MDRNTSETEKPAKLPWQAQLAAGWPLILVAFGGAIGGACGGLGYICSLTLFKKKGVTGLNYFLSALIGLGAILLYVAIIVALTILFPNLFKK